MSKETHIVKHYPTSAELHVEFDFDFKLPVLATEYGITTVDELIKEMVLCGASLAQQTRRKDEKNRVGFADAFIRKLCKDFVEHSNNTDPQKLFKDVGGYWPLDGSMGIKIVYHNQPERPFLDDNEFEISKLE